MLATLDEELAMLEPQQELARRGGRGIRGSAGRSGNLDAGLGRNNWSASTSEASRAGRLKYSRPVLPSSSRAWSGWPSASAGWMMSAPCLRPIPRMRAGDLLAAGELLDEQLEQQREQVRHLMQAQQQAHGELQRLNGRIASLETLVAGRTGPGQKASPIGCKCSNCNRCRGWPRACVSNPGWERAVETVLGADPQAVVLDDFVGLSLDDLEQGELRWSARPIALPRARAACSIRSRSLHDLRRGWPACARWSRWSRRWSLVPSWARRKPDQS